MNLSGMNIVFHPLLVSPPKFKLSTECPCTDSFRVEFNQWLLEFFGIDKRGIVIGNTIYMPMEMKAIIKEII